MAAQKKVLLNQECWKQLMWLLRFYWLVHNHLAPGLLKFGCGQWRKAFSNSLYINILQIVSVNLQACKSFSIKITPSLLKINQHKIVKTFASLKIEKS